MSRNPRNRPDDVVKFADDILRRHMSVNIKLVHDECEIMKGDREVGRFCYGIPDDWSAETNVELNKLIWHDTMWWVLRRLSDHIYAPWHAIKRVESRDGILTGFSVDFKGDGLGHPDKNGEYDIRSTFYLAINNAAVHGDELETLLWFLRKE